jgi:hypothetical protein
MKESEHILRRAEGGGDHMRTDQQHGGPGERGGLRLGIQRQRTGNPGHTCCRVTYAYSPGYRIRIHLIRDPDPDPVL